jgi:hypothetical protein
MVQNRRGYYKAVIKLDDFKKTGSTGGIVTDIYFHYTDLAEGISNPLPYDINDKNYICIKCSPDCKIGWIYTSKTNILVDSNKPINI